MGKYFQTTDSTEGLPPGQSHPLRVVLLGLGLLVPPQIHSAEWYFEPNVVSRAIYNSNIRLRAEDPEEVFGVLVRFGAEMGVRTERTGVSLIPSFRSARYDGSDELDTDDQSLGVLAYHDYENGRIGLSGDYERDSTITSDPDVVDTSELISTGLVQRQVRKERYDLAPSWSHNLTERTSMSLSGLYSQQTYDDAAVNGFSDYDYYTLVASLGHRLTDRDQIGASVSASRFEVEQSSNTTDDLGFLATYDRELSPTLSGHVGLGVRFTQFDFVQSNPGQADEDTGLLAQVGLAGDYEFTNWSANYTRSVNPAGAGRLIESDEIDLQGTWHFSERLLTRLEARYKEDTRLGGQTATSQRNFALLKSQLRWRWTRNLTLIATYRFTRQEAARTADAHMFSVGLSFDGDRYSVTR